MTRTPRALPLILAAAFFLLLWGVLAYFGGKFAAWWATWPAPTREAEAVPRPEPAAPIAREAARVAETAPTAAAPAQLACGDLGTGPRPAEPGTPPHTWILADDYPIPSLRAGEQGRVALTMVVDEAGRVADCLIRESSGSAALDAAACAALKGRGRFVPALDAQGCPTRSRVNRNVRWTIPQ